MTANLQLKFTPCKYLLAFNYKNLNKLKIVLKKYGVTRVELGKRMGVSHQRITELANKTAFSYPILYRIAKALQVEPGDLLLTLDEINQLSDEEIDDMIPRKRKKSNK